MKSEAEETVLNQNPIQEKTPTQENQEEEIFMKSEEQKSMNFEWEMNAQNAQPAPAEKKVYQLDDEEEVLPTDSTEPVRIQERSPEEQNRLNQERMNRIQEFTRKLKNPNGLNEFEKEPAFMRRNIQLDQSAPSQNENISRFGLNDDENGTTLRGNNSFLHDNVD
jgi:cell division protein FtsZ